MIAVRYVILQINISHKHIVLKSDFIPEKHASWGQKKLSKFLRLVEKAREGWKRRSSVLGWRLTGP
jgi:hypothetical protein